MRETNKEKQLNEIFNQLLELIKSEIDSKLFDTMFADGAFELKSIEGDKALFVAESPSDAAIIKSALLPLLSSSLSKLLETDVKIEIIDKITYNNRNKSVDKANSSFFQNCYLLKQYTFDNFVIGSCNRRACLAGLNAVENPGSINPIFIYSKSGLGKTHLLQAIGNAYKEKYPNSKVLYITSDDFISEFIKFSLGNKDSNSLKDFFSTIDLLLVDDIQFFAKKEACQTMFFNVFNLLVTQKKQIVLTSDKSPSELKDLPDRLVTRFESGLSLNIDNPNKDTLIEILKLKIKNSSLSIDIFNDDVLEYLANNYGKNVRELEGAYNNLLFAITTSKPEGQITLDFTKGVFEFDEKRREKASKVDVDLIIKTTAEYYNFTESQLKSKVRTSQLALARQIAMYLSRTLLNTPYQEIGRQFGKDHTTVLANVNKIQNSLKTDVQLKRVVSELTSKINISKAK